MNPQQRKDAIRAWKERTPVWGAFAVRCHASGEAWVGSSPNLPAASNSIWFSLRAGLHREKAMQDAWNAHGEQSFSFESLEQFEDEANPITLRDDLKELKRKWAARLAAPTLL